MGTKNNPSPHDCISKAEPDEPHFTLLGRDPCASMLVTMWIKMRSLMGGTEPEVLAEAMQCAESLAAWSANLGKDRKLGAARAAMQAICGEASRRPLLAGSIAADGSLVIDETPTTSTERQLLRACDQAVPYIVGNEHHLRRIADDLVRRKLLEPVEGFVDLFETTDAGRRALI